MRKGNLPSKNQGVEGEISIVQSSDVARRVDHHRAPSGSPFGPNEISIFCPRTLQAERNLQNAIFSGTSHQNTWKQVIIDHISTNRWYVVGWQHWHCSRFATEEISRQLCTYRRHQLQIFRIAIFLLCAKVDFKVSLQWCRGCPHCKITSVKSTIPLSEKIKLDHFKPTLIKGQWQFVFVEVSESSVQTLKSRFAPSRGCHVGWAVTFGRTMDEHWRLYGCTKSLARDMSVCT